MARRLRKPTDAELAILRVLWARGPSTVRQGAAIGGVAALLLRIARRSGPRVRYAIGCAALASMVAAPLTTARVLWRTPEPFTTPITLRPPTAFEPTRLQAETAAAHLTDV